MSKASEKSARIINRSVLVNCTPEVLYPLVTKPEGMVNWLCQRANPTDDGFILEWDSEFGVIEVPCKIVEEAAPNRFVFVLGWEADAPELNTTVEFGIKGEGKQSLFEVSESGFGQGKYSDEAIEEHAHGWNHFLINLAEFIG